MKNFLIATLIMIGISVFCGVVIISIGFGSVITQLNYIAKPIVCGNNVMDVTQHVDHPEDGETNWSVSIECVDNDTGARTDVTGLTQLVAGLIYSLLPMAGLVGLALLSWNKKQAQVNSPIVNGASEPPVHDDQENPQEEPDGIETKLARLKKLRENDLITEEDYQKKKEEILKFI